MNDYTKKIISINKEIDKPIIEVGLENELPGQLKMFKTVKINGGHDKKKEFNQTKLF